MKLVFFNIGFCPGTTIDDSPQIKNDIINEFVLHRFEKSISQLGLQVLDGPFSISC